MKRKIYIEDIELPAYDENDLLETISKSKQIAIFNRVQKKETSFWRMIKQIILIDGWKSLAIQGFVILLGLFMIWTASSFIISLTSIALISTGGMIMATVIAGELIHSDIYGMREVEMSCICNPQRLLIWKMLFLSILAIIGVSLLSYAVMLKTDIDYTTLLYGGCVPFLFMNGLTLILHANKNPFQILGTLYICTFVFMCVMEYRYFNQLILFFESWGSILVVTLFLLNVMIIFATRTRRYVV